MISLEQVRQLDIRVKKAVAAVKNLSMENAQLKARIAGLEGQLENLSNEASSRKADEQELEVSLQGVLDVLDEVDSETSGLDPEPPEDNYVIETVSLDDESGIEDQIVEEPPVPGEDSISFEKTVIEEAEIAVDEESPSDETERAIDQSPTAADTISEEVPGVGQVVEFTQPADDETVDESETDDTEEKKDAPDESAVEPKAEEVDLSTEDESVVVEDDFQSEFDIF